MLRGTLFAAGVDANGEVYEIAAILRAGSYEFTLFLGIHFFGAWQSHPLASSANLSQSSEFTLLGQQLLRDHPYPSFRPSAIGTFQHSPSTTISSSLSSKETSILDKRD